jgi:flagellar motor switch protein FliM
MEKVLSQDEVDALLNGISGGDIETEAEPQPEDDGRVQKFDLTNQDRIINDRFARIYRLTLSGMLRKMVDITVTQKEMSKFGEFIRTLPVPTSLHIIRMNPLRGNLLLVIESRLIFNLMDCFFGGSGRSHYKIEGREFTAIEGRIIRRILHSALKDLHEAWHPAVQVEFEFVRSEMNPQFAGIVPPSDLVIVIRFELELDRVIGEIILCVPYSTIEPIRSLLNASYQSDQLEIDQAWINRLKSRLFETHVDLTVELGRTSISAHDLLHLDVGDIVVLDKETRKPVTMMVQGIPKFIGHAGKSRGNRAVQVLDVT